MKLADAFGASQPIPPTFHSLGDCYDGSPLFILTKFSTHTSDAFHTAMVRVESTPIAEPDTLLAALWFGDAPSNVTDCLPHHGMTVLGQSSAWELWHCARPVMAGALDDVHYREADGHLFGSIRVRLTPQLEDLTAEVYRKIFACANSLGHPHLLRFWNFLPDINGGDGDAERYRRFCVGRARAFDVRPGSQQGDWPAGTAIGTHSGNHLLVYFLAALEPGQPVENPRQVSAYDYPRQYGPRPPLFARATVTKLGGSARMLVSGTASITGHESRHPDDLRRQLEETWHNLHALCAKVGGATPESLRVYLRRADDYEWVKNVLTDRLPDVTSVLYLHADICRDDLLLEIEGVYRLDGS